MVRKAVECKKLLVRAHSTVIPRKGYGSRKGSLAGSFLVSIQHIKNKTVKIFGYAWKIILGLINVIVASAVFSVASTKFETVALAVLVLIYLNVLSFSAIWGLTEMRVAEALDEEFKTIKKLLNFKSDGKGDNDEDYTEEGLKEIQKERKDAKNYLMGKFYINIGFQLIVYVIALFHLLAAISS